jgi:hypothetical protein
MLILGLIELTTFFSCFLHSTLVEKRCLFVMILFGLRILFASEEALLDFEESCEYFELLSFIR